MRALGRFARRLLIGTALSVLLPGILLQIPPIALLVARSLIALVNPWPGTSVSIGSAGGTWLTSLSLTDVRITHPKDSLDISIDTLHASYDLPALFRGTLHFRLVSLSRPTVRSRVLPDGNLLFLQPFASPDTTGQDSSRGLRVQGDYLEVSRGGFVLVPSSDPLFHRIDVHDIRLVADSILIQGSVAAVIDTIGCRAAVDGQTKNELRLNVAGRVSAHSVDIQALSLVTAKSHIFGKGTLPLPLSPAHTLPGANLQLTASPLSYDDLHSLLPDLGPGGEARINLGIDGNGDSSVTRLSVLFPGGGSVDLGIDTRVGAGESLNLRITGSTDGLSSSGLTGKPDTSESIQSKFLLVGTGSSPADFSGSANITVFPSRIAGIGSVKGSLNAKAHQGEINATVRGEADPMVIAAEAELSPFAPVPKYAVRGSMKILPSDEGREILRRLAGLSMSFALSGQGFDVGNARAFVLLHGRWTGNPYFDSLLVNAEIDHDTLRATGSLATSHGGLRGTTRAVLTEPLFACIEIPEFRNISLDKLASDLPSSLLTGSAQATVSGTSLSDASGKISLSLDSSRIAGIMMNRLRTGITIDTGRIRFTASVEGDPGSVELEGRIDPFANSPFLIVDTTTFRHLDLGALLRSEELFTDLNGWMKARAVIHSQDDLSRILEGSLNDAAGAVEGSVEVALDTSQINRQLIRVAGLRAGLLDNQLETALEVHTPGGGFRGLLQARPFDLQPTFSLPELRLEHIDLGAVAGITGLRTNLTGTIAAAVQGSAIEDARGTLSVELENSTINAATLRRGSVQARMDGGPFSIRGAGDFNEGSAAITADGRVLRQGVEGALSVDVRFSDISSLLAADSLLPSTLQAHGSIQGRWGPSAVTALAGTLHGQLSYGELQVDTILCDLSLRGRTLEIDTVQITSNVATVTGTGTLALFDSLSTARSDFSMSATASSIHPLERIFGLPPSLLHRARIECRASGPSESTEIQVATDIETAALGDLAVNSLRSSIQALITPSLDIESLEGTLGLQGFQYGSITVQNAQASLRTSGNRHEISAQFQLSKDFAVGLGGTIEAGADSIRVRIDSLVSRSMQQIWVLERPATLVYGPRLEVRDFALHAGTRDLVVDGILDPLGEQNFTVSADSLNLSSFGNVFGRPELEGFLSADLHISGPAGSAQAKGQVSGQVQQSGRLLGELSAFLDWQGNVLSVEGKIGQPGGGSMAASATLPAVLSLHQEANKGPLAEKASRPRSLDMLLAADKFDLEFLRPFLSPRTITSLGGILTADLNATGPLDSIQATGTVTLDSGWVAIAPLGIPYSGIRLHCTAEGMKVRVDDAEITSGGGTLRLNGTLDLATPLDPGLDLTIGAEEFLAVQTPGVKVGLSGALQVGGKASVPHITGDLLLNDSYVVIPETMGGSSVESVELTPEDYAMLARHFGYRPRVEPTTQGPSTIEPALDITLTLQQNTWIRKNLNPTLAIELQGSVRVQRSPGEPLRLNGTIRPVTGRSYVGQFGRQFEITGGEIIFSGTPEDLELHIDSEYRVPSKGGSSISEVVIRMKVDSKLGRFTYALTSDPAMDESEILSYLATGQSRTGALANAADQGGLAGAMALEQLVGVAGGLTEGSLPIDVFQIRQDGARGITIVAGNYVNPKTYMGVRQPILLNQGTQDTYYDTRTEFEVEYEARPWLFLNFQGGSARLLLFLKARHAY